MFLYPAPNSSYNYLFCSYYTIYMVESKHQNTLSNNFNHIIVILQFITYINFNNNHTIH